MPAPTHDSQHRALRRDAFLFAASEANSLRARLDRLERALNLPEWRGTYLDHHADAMADALDPPGTYVPDAVSAYAEVSEAMG